MESALFRTNSNFIKARHLTMLGLFFLRAQICRKSQIGLQHLMKLLKISTC